MGTVQSTKGCLLYGGFEEVSMDGSRGGQGVRTPPPGKLRVAIVVLRNTGTDIPRVAVGPIAIQRRSDGPL